VKCMIKLNCKSRYQKKSINKIASAQKDEKGSK